MLSIINTGTHFSFKLAQKYCKIAKQCKRQKRRMKPSRMIFASKSGLFFLRNNMIFKPKQNRSMVWVVFFHFYCNLNILNNWFRLSNKTTNSILIFDKMCIMLQDLNVENLNYGILWDTLYVPGTCKPERICIGFCFIPCCMARGLGQQINWTLN